MYKNKDGVNKIKFNILNVRSGYHLIIKATVNEIETFMLLDTGATHTIFDIKFINNLSINLELSKITAASISSNMENNFEVILPSLQLGSLVIKNYKTYALNLDYINNIYLKVGLQKISGIVGNDILVEYKAKIDYENLILLLNDK